MRKEEYKCKEKICGRLHCPFCGQCKYKNAGTEKYEEMLKIILTVSGSYCESGCCGSDDQLYRCLKCSQVFTNEESV